MFLVSTKAGGQGLNLIRSSRVFLMDPWWSSASESQAIDRVGRLQWLLRDLCKVYALTGKLHDATAIYQELLSRSQTEYISALTLADLAWALGKNEEAIKFFEKAKADRASQLESDIKRDPSLSLIFNQLRAAKK